MEHIYTLAALARGNERDCVLFSFDRWGNEHHQECPCWSQRPMTGSSRCNIGINRITSHYKAPGEIIRRGEALKNLPTGSFPPFRLRVSWDRMVFCRVSSSTQNKVRWRVLSSHIGSLRDRLVEIIQLQQVILFCLAALNKSAIGRSLGRYSRTEQFNSTSGLKRFYQLSNQ
jgi:hypothetical protein